MPIVALATVDSAGGILISQMQSFVTCKGHRVILLHDPVTGHGPAPHAAPHVAECSATVRINGIGIAREGDHADCGHPCTGSSNIKIGK